MISTAEYEFNAGLSAPLTLAVVADLHSEDFCGLIDMLKDISPSAVLCPGDVIHKASEDEAGLDFLRECARLFPTFCSIGNHEVKHGSDVRPQLRATGATLLDNEFCSFGGITIGGLSSGYTVSSVQGRLKKTPPPDLVAMTDFFNADGFRLLLCHHPEYFRPYLMDKSVDLVVSGHAHGGQWRLFGRGIFAPGQGIFPRYTKGLYNGRLLVSAGLSNKTFIPRIFNPRQLVIIKLK